MCLAILNMGPGEMLVIALVLLLLFGRRLPEVMRSMGKGISQFKKGLHDPDDEDSLALNQPDNKPASEQEQPVDNNSSSTPVG